LATGSGARQVPTFLHLTVDAPDGVDKPWWNCDDRLAINQPATIRFRSASFPQAFSDELAGVQPSRGHPVDPFKRTGSTDDI
jgi:hypothetical protein